MATRIPKPPKERKYKNTKVEWKGMTFDSKKELARWLVLKGAENNGLISDLKRQVKYELVPGIKERYIEHLKTKDKIKERIVQMPISYKCDFQYVKDGKIVVEDVKASKNLSAIDKSFILKDKLMFFVYGIRIKKVYKPSDEI